MLFRSEKILLELFSQYIKQRAKLIMRKQDNSLSTTSSLSPLTTETQHSIIAISCQDTSEKTTMNSIQLHQLCKEGVDNIIDRMHDLCAEGRAGDAAALYEEIQDWIIQKDELEVMSLEYINDV